MTLLDTNTIIHYIKGNRGVVTKMQDQPPHDLAVPTIVIYELEHGSLHVKSAKRRALIRSVLQDLETIPFDGPAALEAAKIRIELESKGAMIGPMDTLIAGVARSRNALLVTNNVKEFSRVKGLRIADWRD